MAPDAIFYTISSDFPPPCSIPPSRDRRGDIMNENGIRKLEWARTHMRVLRSIAREMKESQSLKGIGIGMALHVEAKTGILALTLKEAGADVRLASCNPLSTDDDVAGALNDLGLPTFARKGESSEEYYRNLDSVLAHNPRFLIDDGCDLIKMVHERMSARSGTGQQTRGGTASGTTGSPCLDPDPGTSIPCGGTGVGTEAGTEGGPALQVLGASEETTTGIVRLRAMERDGVLKFPVLSANDALMKHLFDNRYGTGQSTFDGILTATNLIIAGKEFVVGGYGWCGRGIAMRASGLGAQVIVTEVDPVKAVEARLDGFRVMPMREAVRIADFIVTATGNRDIVTREHFEVMKDGCVLSNSGHFNNEINMGDLEAMAVERKKVRNMVDGYTLGDGRTVYLLADGRLINLAAGQGHPVEIMDMSFAIQALGMEYLVRNHGNMEARVHQVPQEIDERVARCALEAMGITIDTLSDIQREYMASWSEGT